MSPPAQATPSSLEGSVLGGRYRVGKRLGEGGMGAVYEALQVDIGRRVALKLLHPELSEDAELVARFRREAEASASLGDPNIVQVTDFGHSEEHGAFLVMELLSGAPLASVLANEGKLPPARVAFIAHQVLGALASAHRAGIVHRDLKPDNVFLTSVSGIADIVKLLDFGIAKLIANDGGQRTATGVVLGTPAYMSPEQARGREVDARTDLYAVGVLMYQALSGRLPYRASNYNAILFAIIEETPPPLGELRPDLDPSLIAVIERAMAKEPSDRFASAEEMREALEPFLRPATDLAAFPRTRRVEAAREPTPLELAPTMTTPVVDRPPPADALRTGPRAEPLAEPAPKTSRRAWARWLMGGSVLAVTLAAGSTALYLAGSVGSGAGDAAQTPVALAPTTAPARASGEPPSDGRETELRETEHGLAQTSPIAEPSSGAQTSQVAAPIAPAAGPRSTDAGTAIDGGGAARLATPHATPHHAPRVPATPLPIVQLVEERVGGLLTVEQVRQTVTTHAGVRQCFKAPRWTPDGRYSLWRLSLGADGRVIQVESLNSADSHAETNRCLRPVLGRLRFDPPARPGAIGISLYSGH